MQDHIPQISQIDRLRVEIHPDRLSLGEAAARAVAAQLRQLLQDQAVVRMIFAAAPSQNEFLAALAAAAGIDWSRVTAMHMDEYVGLSGNDPRSFSSYLREHLFGLVKPGKVHYLDGAAASPQDECARYAGILRENPVDLVCMGIGENGHIAFNDPPVADFEDPKLVKVVELEESCRLQQVHDGCFPALEKVPTHAMTLTIPALFGGKRLFCMVPGPTKAAAVRRTLIDPVSPDCPATILRTHPSATLYLDADSAAEWGGRSR